MNTVTSKNITERLLLDTNNLSEPKNYRHFFDSDFLNETYLRLAINMAIKHNAKYNFRVWVNQKQQALWVDKIFNTLINSSETLEQWTKRIFDNERFCIVFSQAEQYNDSLAINIAKFLQPIFKQVGMPLGGADITFFIGNYGFTPAGVHQDQNENCIFHFHLGPGYKELFLWEPDKFNKLTGSFEPYSDPKKIIEHAERFELNANDFLVLPPKYYHVGLTEQFSADMTVVISDCTNIRLTQEIFNNICTANLSSAKNIFKLPSVYPEKDVDSLVSNICDQICINYSQKAKTLDETIKSQVHDFYLAMISNGGLNFPPLLGVNNKIEWNNKRIQIVEPFKITYKMISNGEIELFIRGRKLTMQSCHYCHELVDRLNTGKIYEIEKLVYRDFPSYNVSEIFQVINLFWENKAIKIVN